MRYNPLPAAHSSYRVIVIALAIATPLFMSVAMFLGRTPFNVSADANDENGRAEWEHARLRDPATGEIPAGIFRRERQFAATLPVAGQHRLSRTTQGADFGWASQGPDNIGGRTRSFAVDRTGADTIIAAAISGGLWRSSDAGRTWNRTSLPTQFPSVGCLVQDPRPGKNHIWYAGTGEVNGASQSASGAYYLGDGLFKSTDNGRSWSQLPSTVSNTPQTFDRITDFIVDVAVDPTSLDTDKVFIATIGTIMRSTDGGATWRSALTSSPQAFFTQLTVSTRGVFYATFSWTGLGSAPSGRRGVYRSADGLKWTAIGPPSLPDSVRRIVPAIAPSNENVVYFVAETPHAGQGGRNFQGDSVWGSLWRYQYDSGDGSGSGGRWQNLSEFLPAFGGSFGDFNPQYSYDLEIAVSPHDENIVAIGGTNLYVSTDGFRTSNNTRWIGGYRNIPFNNRVIVPLSYPGHHPDQHHVAFSPDDSLVMYSSNDGGIFRTDDFLADSVNWVSMNDGYVTSQFYTVAMNRDVRGRLFIIGGMQDNGTWSTSSPDPHAPWVERGTGDGSFCAVADSGRLLYVSKQQGKTYRVRLNDSGTMTSFARIDPVGGSGYRFINPIAIDPHNSDVLFILGGKTVWRNSNVSTIAEGTVDSVSENWKPLQATTGGASLTALAVSTSAPADRLWYGNDSGRVYRVDNVSGDSVEIHDVTGAAFPRGGYVNCIAVDPGNGDRAVVVFSNYSVVSLFLTTDAGETWTPVAGNLEQYANGGGNGPSCRWFSFARQNGGTLFLVGTSVGLYSTSNLDGVNTVWALEGEGTIGNVPVDMIAITDNGTTAGIATHGRGVFTTMLPTLGRDRDGDESPAAIWLARPYPDPASGRFTIRWGLASPCDRVRLAVYDQLGRERRVLHEGPSSRGERDVECAPSDAGRLPAGIYYIRLEANGRTVTRTVRLE